MIKDFTTRIQSVQLVENNNVRVFLLNPLRFQTSESGLSPKEAKDILWFLASD